MNGPQRSRFCRPSEVLRNANRVLAWASFHAAPIVLCLAGAVSVLAVLLSLEGAWSHDWGREHVPGLLGEASKIFRGAALLAITGLLFLKLWQRGGVVVDLLAVVLAIYTLSGLLLGLIWGNDFYIFGRHLFAALMILMSYWFGVVAAQEIRNQEKILYILGSIILAAVPAIVFGMWNLLGAQISTFGVSPLFLTLDAAVSSGRFWIAAICFLIIALSNKRAIVIGGCAIGAILIARQRLSRHRFLVRAAAATAITVVLYAGAVAFTKVVDLLVPALSGGKVSVAFSEKLARRMDSDGAPAAEDLLGEKVASSITSEGAENGFTALDYYTSARMAELVGSFGSISHNAVTLAVGRGFGSDYFWTAYSRNLDKQVSARLHQPDFLPTYFLLTGGIFFSLAISSLLAWGLIGLFARATLRQVAVGSLFVLGFSIDNLLSFQPNSPLFWIMLGALCHGRLFSTTREDVLCAQRPPRGPSST